MCACVFLHKIFINIFIYATYSMHISNYLLLLMFKPLALMAANDK